MMMPPSPTRRHGWWRANKGCGGLGYSGDRARSLRAGKHAKFVSSRATNAPELKFPKLLDPIDDQPPATIITWPKRGLPVKLGKSGTLEVGGTNTDDYKIVRVVVNSVEVNDLDYNFTGWSVKISSSKPGKVKLTALATDKVGNREQTAHILIIIIIE